MSEKIANRRRVEEIALMDVDALEVEQLGFKFSIPVNFSELSIDELDDLAALGIGGKTCIIINDSAIDITRMA